MGQYIVYEEPLKKVFKAPTLSLAFCCHVLLFLAACLLPIAISYGTNGLWVKEGTFFEQPAVTFTRHFLIDLEGADTHITWSSLPQYNTLNRDTLRPSVVKLFEEDLDHDGKTDTLHITGSVPLKETETITDFSAAFFLDYVLEDNLRLEIQTPLFLHETSGVARGALSLFGDLQLFQVNSLPYGVTKVNTTVVAQMSAAAVLALDGSSHFIASYFASRNESVHLAHSRASWTARSAASPSNFVFEFAIRVPRQEVHYQTGAGEALKFAWIQYLALLVLILSAVRLMKWVLYKHKVLTTRGFLNDTAKSVMKSQQKLE
eukprot:GCRY01003004.1.p1 GENE.GCRY01003004.1~~GCRY01003004.1.p1  ORF type:complete len:318 (+),score=60.21 GCRY01003004.1:52-1005(+)